jgi:LysB family phage lysis regulatory protein
VIQIVAGLSIALALVTGGGWLYVKALRAEKAQIEQAYTVAAQVAIDLNNTLDQQLAERKRTDAILLDRSRRLQKLETSNARLNQALDALKQHDQPTRDWAAVRLPDPVARLLNHPDPAGPDQGGEAIPQPDPDRTHPRP